MRRVRGHDELDRGGECSKSREFGEKAMAKYNTV